MNGKWRVAHSYSSGWISSELQFNQTVMNEWRRHRQADWKWNSTIIAILKRNNEHIDQILVPIVWSKTAANQGNEIQFDHHFDSSYTVDKLNQIDK